MASISIFEIFKIGVGPSSSHTLGPWNAALNFVENISIKKVDRIQIHLYGSLSKTGVGHATDKAIILGILGYLPQTIDTSQIDKIIATIQEDKVITVQSKKMPFDFQKDLIFESFEHELHPNTLLFKAFSNGKILKEQIFASVGGGFIESEVFSNVSVGKRVLPHPIEKGADLLNYTIEHDCSISDIVYRNELALKTASEIDEHIDSLLDAILDSVYDGCRTDGILPGCLNVTRRAKGICDKLIGGASYTSREGRVVTSPTNGAAGVIPSVLMYYMLFCDYKGKEYIKKFLFTAGEIGSIFKKGATISAAVGGCQAEIGVSSAMAAGALTEVLGGTPGQCLMAAEIAMEHHLGLTCDPIKGLVQVPCIERNAMGAIKAITASNLAIESDSENAIVNIDTVIKTMWDVALDMHSKYKETSEGGLAINLPVVNPSC